MADTSLNNLPDCLKKDPHFLYALADIKLRMRWDAKWDMFKLVQELAKKGNKHAKNHR